MGTISAIHVDGRQDTANAAGFGRRGPHRVTFASVIFGLVDRLEELAARRRSRLALLDMTDDQLKDIGISRADAVREGLRSSF